MAGARFAVSRVDARGCPQSGATATAAAAYERALAAFQGWRVGAEAELAPALQEAPGFVMAHVLEGYLRVASRDPRRVRSARPMLARAAALPMNSRERLHVAALGAVLGDDLPGYGAVLAMHAFGLEESGEYEHAEQSARAALALDPGNARAHHAMAHVFEMTGRAEAGIRWLRENTAGWAAGSTVARHCFWHLALFHLARGEIGAALALYDERIGPGPDADVADLIDASALL